MLNIFTKQNNKNDKSKNIKLKTLFISSFGNSGGSEIALFDLLKSIEGNKKIFIFSKGNFCKLLIENKYDVTIAIDKQISLSQNLSTKSLLLNIRKLVVIYFKLTMLIKKSQPNLIITNDIKSLIIYYFIFFKSKYHIHYLHSIIDHNFAGKANFLIRQVLNHFQNYICNSKYTSNCLKDLSKEKNILINYQYFNFNNLNINHTKLTKFSDSIVIGIVSRINSKKNIDKIILAVNQSRLKNHNIVIHIYGESYTNEDLKYKSILINLIKQLGMIDSIKFMGHVSDLNLIYKNISILVTASELESFGRVIIEAITYKVPVIASKIPAHLELIEDGVNGLLFDNSVNDLLNKIIILCDDSILYTKIVNKAYDDALNKYSKLIFDKKVRKFIIDLKIE